MLWQLLLAIVGYSVTFALERALASADHAELHELASSVRQRGGISHDPRVRQRLSLRHLESMWHTSMGKELDCASSGREEAFLATLDTEWAQLIQVATQDARQEGLAKSSGGMMPRSPFLVCTDRHPDAIRSLKRSESFAYSARARLVYSRGDTACLLAGLRLGDLDSVRAAEGIHVVDPLPHPAKLSRSLYATLAKPLEWRGELSQEKEGIGGSISEAPRYGGSTTEQNLTDDDDSQHRSSRREIRFNHGEGLPDDLDIYITPGAWEPGLADAWTQHLDSFGSAGQLWDEHLRELFLWTRSKQPEEAAPAVDDEVGLRGKESIGAGKRRGARSHKLIAAHGLNETAGLWELVVACSSKEDDTCNLGQLRVSPENDRRSNDAKGQTDDRNGRRGRLGVGVGRSGWQSAGSPDGGEIHHGDEEDRIVLHGAGSLGKTEEDNAHCLLTILAYLATRPEVAYVDDVPRVIPFNIEAAWITQSGRETTYPLWNHGIDGRTEIIAVADSGLDMNSCFFKEDNGGENIECSTYSSPVFDIAKRKVVQYVGYVDCEDTKNGHGTHVSGSAAGSLSETSPGEHFGDGTGFHSKLAIFDFGDSDGSLVTPSNLQTQMLEPPYAVGARVSSNSWGAIRTTYTSLDRQMDSAAYSRPDMVLIVAAGNCGDAISGCEYQGVGINGAGSILSPALSKNVIAVGASEASPSSAGLANNLDEVAYFSSQGPTVDDGRIKPDVVAPGYHLFSATANPGKDESCEIGPMAGTSMATPVVAGSAAMVRQYFIQGWYPTGQPTPSDMFNPSNALVKAILIASGTAMASYDSSTGTTTLGSPPDGIQGFGRVLLDSVLNLRGSVDLYVEDAIEIHHGEVHDYTVEIGGSTSGSSLVGNMKVAMVWIEPAALTGSVSPVFNDLDLLVVGHKGSSETAFYPNNLATKDPDNTVEVVSISGAESFDWFQVTVTGASVTTDSLPYYALVVVGGVATDYSPASSTGRSWFVRWKMKVEGIPVTQAATMAFEASLAEAISSEIGDHAADNSTVLVKIDRSGDATEDVSVVTVEISVASEADGYAVLTYVVTVMEGSSTSADEGLAAALNSALESRTTEDCRCVAVDNDGAAYDCSACLEGEAFSTAESISTAQGDYDLLSTEGFGRSPVSIFGLRDSDSQWSGFTGGKEIRGILRTDSYVHVAAIVFVIVAATSLCSCMLRRCYKPTEPASPGSDGSVVGSQEFNDFFGGSKPGTPLRSRSPVDRNNGRRRNSPNRGNTGGDGLRRKGWLTPRVTPGDHR